MTELSLRKSLGEKLPLELDWGKELDAKILHSESRLIGLDINDTSIVIRMNKILSMENYKIIS